ncbi:anhydro-N-acetylmuramic acid kinase [Algibacter mikhailovii]|uniref:Anhydro-N-acetylmuramic acid kinase n=1 Tax=Algibacter mikhailovii TaxID=425498 RepID=A0A918R175_9FLAO|nr:anhydro-N-acetylmuramic acid kinase [Algibacter mikhailovii]GGZ79672.1 anhydro-N-acetylmuramic acid kinase [Algibacter mikhailovii]
MNKNEYHVVGVMSGTSLDGIDLIQAKFYFEEYWRFEILNTETFDYEDSWRDILANLVSKSLEELQEIDVAYTTYLGTVINAFIRKYKIKNIDAVCSHGHTALHQPDQGLTYQIGNRPELAQLLNLTVVCDFRVQDVQLKGQGAPLVPIGDKLLFSEYDYCINLGGFANISMDVNEERIAYDIAPVNIVLNYYANKLELDYDPEGRNASEGNVNTHLLEVLNSLPFYNESYPKSLGLEWVNTHVLPVIESYSLMVKDVLRTFVEHVAIQIANQIQSNTSATILITGGGAYNTFLIERIKAFTDGMIIIPSQDVLEFKEALIFGFLGVLRLRGQNNCLKSVTGATKNHSSGNIFLS